MRLPKTRPLVLAVVLLVAGFLVGRACQSDAPRESVSGPAETSDEPSVWTCSMHPQVRLPEPGKCPICLMDLIPADVGGGDEDLGPRALEMSAAAMRLADIVTAPVERRHVAHEVSMVGKVAFDETRISYLTAWVGGRLDRLFVDYTGVTVREGDHMVEIYSPRLYAAQQELLQAIATADRLEGSSLEILRTTTDATVHSSRQKLRLFGLSERQVQDIVERGTPDEHVVLNAPSPGIVVHKNAVEGMYVDEGSRIYTIADLSKVWILLDAYESDIAWLRYGQDVTFHVEAYPGQTFHARVAFINPVLDDRTRTVKVRLNVDNADLRLKPDMFVSATVNAVLTRGGQVVDEELEGKWMCPMHPEIIADGPGECPECGMQLAPVSELGFVAHPEEGPSLVIPATAPLITGKRAVVYVRLAGREMATFEGRVITLGPRAGDWYVVREGLAEGELVVVNGSFKIDSELQIRARPSMMSPEGGARPPGHQHGGAGGGEAPAGRTSDPGESAGHREHGEHSAGATRMDVPAEFRRQLGGVMEAYLDLQNALTNDDAGQAPARSVLESLGGVDMGLLEGDGHMAWMELVPDLQRVAEQVAAAPGLDGRRARFASLSSLLLRALDAFGYERATGDLGVFHCPMALDGEGADWVQAGDQTSNPYFGSTMLRCGDRTRVLRQEP